MELPIIGINKISQVCVIVKDVEVSKQKYAALLGIPAPATVDSGDYEICKTEYYGKPSPESACYMAIFGLADGMQIELIQPKEGKSEWRDFLETHGEGLHHIAFRLKDIQSAIKRCEDAGMTCTQFGYYNDGSGAYAYMDAYKDFKCTIELLEDFDK